MNTLNLILENNLEGYFNSIMEIYHPLPKYLTIKEIHIILGL